MAPTPPKTENADGTSEDGGGAAKKADEPDTYSHDWLISASNALGFQSHEIAGALSQSGVKKNLTIDEAKEIVKKWLKSPVTTSDSEEG